MLDEKGACVNHLRHSTRCRSISSDNLLRLPNLTNSITFNKNLFTAPSSSQLKHSNLAIPGSASPSELSSIQSPVNETPCSSLHKKHSCAEKVIGCEMCANYEIKLQQLQDNEKRLRQQLTTAQNLSESCKSELAIDRALRTDLEQRFQLVQLELSNACQRLSDRLNTLEISQKNRLEEEANRLARWENETKAFSKVREAFVAEYRRMQLDYNALLGRHKARSADMTNQAIDLPQTVDELQERCLSLGEQLIEAKIACEHLEEKLRSELTFTRDQVISEQQSREQIEVALTEEINELRTQLGFAKSNLLEMDLLCKSVEVKDRCIQQQQLTIIDLENTLKARKNENEKLEINFRECWERSQILKQDLDTSEQVQRDFVRLSQSLQMELEKIRQSDTEVRWQYDDDVALCQSCSAPFNKQRRKSHCKHCGKIFCDPCLLKCVPGGPNKRPTHVCNVCHTLLTRDTAPYFSTYVPDPNGSALENSVNKP